MTDSKAPADRDEESEDPQWDLQERVLAEGDVYIEIGCLVSSMAGSGSASIIEFERKWYHKDDGNELVGPFASWKEASDAWDWWMIHTAGDWSITGEMAEESLDRIEVCGLGDDDEPLSVEVNGEEWIITKVRGADKYLWRPKAE